MSTFGQTLGTGWTADTDVFTASLPGDYMSAGKTYGPADKWAMDRSFSRLFQGERGGDATFQDFLNLQKNPQLLFNQIIAKNSPDFLLAQDKLGV